MALENEALMAVPYMKTPPSKGSTLVLELDETLLHYDIDEGLLIRPGAPEFLEIFPSTSKLLSLR